MPSDTDIEALLDVGRQIMTAAACASLITTDEAGLPYARPVRTFPSDDELTKISVPTDRSSRKTVQSKNNSRVVLSYLDVATRGYVTVIGRAVLNDRVEDRKAVWVDPFSAFWPGGPESEDYLLIDVTPERIEMRSFTQGVAEEPTRWTPVTLERTGTQGWQPAG